MARNNSSIGYVIECIECEGFDYAFVDYSDFAEVKDEQFHTLRKAYLDARKALADYVGVEG